MMVIKLSSNLAWAAMQDMLADAESTALRIVTSSSSYLGFQPYFDAEHFNSELKNRTQLRATYKLIKGIINQEQGKLMGKP